MLNREDKPLFAAILFLAFSLALLWLAPLVQPRIQPSIQKQQDESAQTQASYESRADVSAVALAKYTKWLVIVTAVLAAVSMVQGLFLYRADKSARLSTDAATKAAQAAAESNELTKDNFIANNRPWVTIENMEFKKLFVLSKYTIESECATALRNIGKSPAEAIDIAVDFLFEDERYATALKQHVDRFNFIIKNVVGFRLHKNAAVFSMYPTEVVKPEAPIITQVIGDTHRVRLFFSVIVTYRNPAASPWCASARLYKVIYKGASAIEEFDLGSKLALDPNYMNAEIVYEGNLTT